MASRAVGALVVVAGFASANSAGATAMTDVMNGPKNINKESSYSFQHVFTDSGFAVGSETAIWALLRIVLDDNEDGKDGYKITIGHDAQVFTDDKHADGTLDFVLDSDSLDDLSAGGTLKVTVSSKSCKGSKCGDGAFKFMSSKLTIMTAPVAQPTTVPEPGTLTLLGLGLAGVAALRTRRLRNPAQDTA